MTQQAIKRVALHLWRSDGEPEREGADPTTVGRTDYEREARRVIGALSELGYRVIAPMRRSSSNRLPHGYARDFYYEKMPATPETQGWGVLTRREKAPWIAKARKQYELENDRD